jgi:hypothetical protein
MNMTAVLKRIALVLGVALVVGQFVRPSRANPPIDPAATLEAVEHPPAAVSAALDRSCRDCHSSGTVWPWYTEVAPVSWWIANHVSEGRREVNFSEWGHFNARRKAKKFGEICEQVERREMPIPAYAFVHPEAQLTDSERQAICDWTKAARAKMGPLPDATPAEGKGHP